MKDSRTPTYVAPKVSTLAAGEVLAALGPAAAGSQKIENAGPGGFPLGPTHS